MKGELIILRASGCFFCGEGDASFGPETVIRCIDTLVGGAGEDDAIGGAICLEGGLYMKHRHRKNGPCGQEDGDAKKSAEF